MEDEDHKRKEDESDQRIRRVIHAQLLREITPSEDEVSSLSVTNRVTGHSAKYWVTK